MDLDRAEAIVKGLLTPQHLNQPQVMVFRAAWAGQSYRDQIELLLAVCQTYRCLIVLDNAESILQAGAQVGQYRDGYTDYGDLFTSLAQVEHQSCLLLTSREKPAEISQNEAMSTKVRTLVLPELTAGAGQQIFVDRSCQPISPATWAEIDRYCGGNPLAFQIIAAEIIFIDCFTLPPSSEYYLWIGTNRTGSAILVITTDGDGICGRSICGSDLDRDRATDTFLLNTHPITQANTTDYLRQAQLRAIFTPAIDKLRASIANVEQVDPHL